MKSVIMGALSLMCVQLFAFTDINTRFYFDTDKDSLSRQQESELEIFIQNALSQKKYREVYVIGYTDADGSNGYNLDLSRRRASYVSNLLLQKGIPESMIDKEYKGENLPAATNKTEEGKSLNRRVEVILRVYDIYKAADVIYEMKGNPEQKFTIDNTQQSFVEGDKGIKFIFPANCFQTGDNKKFDPKNITVNLVEVKTIQDALFSGVLTESSARPIETGGMYKIKAYADGRELSMKPGMDYTVQINNSDLKNNMSVFAPAPKASGLLAWTDTKSSFKRDSVYNCERPSIKLDKNIINAWTLNPKYSGFLESYTFQLPKPPAKPNLSPRPKEPKEPVRSTYHYHISWMKRLFMSKTAEQKMIQEKYDQLYTIYQKQHDNYLVRLEKYKQDSSNLIAQMQVYIESNKLYNAQLHKIAKELVVYRQALIENAVMRSFQDMKKLLVYKSDKNQLRTYNLYDEIYSDLSVYTRYNKYNSIYNELYQSCLEKLEQVCDRDFPHENFYADTTRSYSGYNDFYFTNNAYQLLREDKKVEKHLSDAVDNFMKAEVESGVFEPGNFTTFYQASLNKFDWVNCDRFYGTDKNNMITVQIPNYNMMDKNIYAIIKDMNCNFSVPLVGGRHTISLPRNKEVVIIAIGLDKNYTPLFAEAKFKTDQNVQVALSFKNAKISEIKNAISDI